MGRVTFDGALTLTYNATTLKLPGSANILTQAGDTALFVQDSGDNVICLVYNRVQAGQGAPKCGGGERCNRGPHGRSYPTSRHHDHHGR